MKGTETINYCTRSLQTRSHARWTSYGTPYDQDGPSYNSTTSMGSQTRSGSDTPGWRAIVDRGGILPCNNYSLRRTLVKKRVDLGQCTISGSRTDLNKLVHQGYFGWISNPLASDVQYATPMALPIAGYHDAYADAYMKFLSAYDGELESLGAFLAEADQMISQLSGIVKSIEALFRRFCYNLLSSYKAIQRLARKRGWKRRRFHRALHLELVQQWFALHFGLIPLVSDVHAIAEALARIYGDERPRKKIKGKGKHVSSPIPVPYTSTHQCAGSITTTWFGNKVYNVLETVKITALLEPEKMYYDPLGVTGLGWQTIPQGVWEWIPYSWIVDYVSNIGDLITAYTHGALHVYSPSEIYIQDSKVTMELTARRETNAPGITAIGKGKIEVQDFKFQRYAWSGALPSLVLDNPLGLSAIRDVHLLMLAIGKLGRETVTEMRIIGSG